MGLYVPRNTKEKVKGRLGWDLNLDAAFLPNHPLIYSALPVTWPCASWTTDLARWSVSVAPVSFRRLLECCL